tara:strand:- start:644 stop:847 length:204 start_codon:yes stop_codon:yes gene_type:complete
MYYPSYYPIHYIIQDCIDYLINSFFDLELPEFEIDDDNYEQKEQPINNVFSYKRNDDDDEFIKVIII